MPEVVIPETLACNVGDVFGAPGRAWLSGLPALLAGAEERWGIHVGPPFPDLSYGYVVPVRLAVGGEAVLKAYFPNDEVRHEIAALRAFEGRGAAQLHAADPDRGLLLMERVRPGTPLSVLTAEDDDAATVAAASAMRRLWRPVPPDHPFPTVAHWAADLGKLRVRFTGGTGPLPARLVAMAEGFFAELAADPDPPLLLHGDLHHGNLLAAEREPWLAIDPKGVVGHPGNELGPILFNPEGIHQRPGLRRVLSRRVDVLSNALGFRRDQVLGWALARTVLSAWWSVEDHGDGWQPAMVIAAALAELLG